MIHFVFIPLIIYTLGMLLVYSFPIHDYPFYVPFLGDRISSAITVLIALVGSYFVIDFKVGLVFACWMVPMGFELHARYLETKD